MNITWLGHSAFLLEDGTNTVLIDPFISGNPRFPLALTGKLTNVSHILLTHAHGDHMGDTLDIAQKTGAKVIAIFETAQYLIKKGLHHDQIVDMNIGGGVQLNETLRPCY